MTDDIRDFADLVRATINDTDACRGLEQLMLRSLMLQRIAGASNADFSGIDANGAESAADAEYEGLKFSDQAEAVYSVLAGTTAAIERTVALLLIAARMTDVDAGVIREIEPEHLVLFASAVHVTLGAYLHPQSPRPEGQQ